MQERNVDGRQEIRNLEGRKKDVERIKNERNELKRNNLKLYGT